MVLCYFFYHNCLKVFHQSVTIFLSDKMVKFDDQVEQSCGSTCSFWMIFTMLMLLIINVVFTICAAAIIFHWHRSYFGPILDCEAIRFTGSCATNLHPVQSIFKFHQHSNWQWPFTLRTVQTAFNLTGVLLHFFLLLFLHMLPIFTSM